MKDSTFTIDQIGKLRRIELKRMEVGEPGLRSEIQALIMRLQSGGVGVKTDDPREVQAKRLWDKGFDVITSCVMTDVGLTQGIAQSFEEFLVTIPEIPEELKAPDERFPELVLVDARLGIEKTCELLSVGYSGNEETFEDFDPKKARTEKVYWIRAQDGRKNNGKSTRTCRKQFAEDEIGLTALESLALFAQNPEGFQNRAMDPSGSVRRGNRDSVVCLHWFGKRPRLDWDQGDRERPNYGSGSRRI